jgi:hypothetical protein
MGIYLPSLWVFGRVGFWIVTCFQICCGKELMRWVENQSPRCFGDWLEERGFWSIRLLWQGWVICFSLVFCAEKFPAGFGEAWWCWMVALLVGVGKEDIEVVSWGMMWCNIRAVCVHLHARAAAAVAVMFLVGDSDSADNESCDSPPEGTSPQFVYSDKLAGRR